MAGMGLGLWLGPRIGRWRAVRAARSRFGRDWPEYPVEWKTTMTASSVYDAQYADSLLTCDAPAGCLYLAAPVDDDCDDDTAPAEE